MADDPVPTSTLADAARDEAAAMRAAIAGRDGADQVRMTVDRFGRLAALLDTLARRGNGCGNRDCMGRTIDGIRFWVTADALAAERARADAAESAARSLAASSDLARLLN